MVTLFNEDGFVWSRIEAADALAQIIVNRDRRMEFSTLAFWLREPERFEINEQVMRVLDLSLRNKLGHKHYYRLLKRARDNPYIALAMYVGNDEKRFEWAVTTLLLLGFSTSSYPKK